MEKENDSIINQINNASNDSQTQVEESEHISFEGRYNSGAEDAGNDACEGMSGENTNDTPKDIATPVFEQAGWKEKVQDFLQRYPIAKDFASDIGRIIAQDSQLASDENCLERALAATLAASYVSPRKLASDEEFLSKYVLNNQIVKDRIIEEYFEQLQQNRPPKSISSGGQMTIAPPSRPKSIAEAGSVIKAMLTNRRI